MKTIAHISDLHFGTEDPAVAAGLLAELDGHAGPAPTLVAISGDLTQRAREDQFRAACEYLEQIPGPTIVVPGNHDVPLYDIVSRFARPYARYQAYFRDNLMPFYADDELAIVGLTTAHGFTMKGGKVSATQIDQATALLAGQDGRWKAVLAHHPFVMPDGVKNHKPVDGADWALPKLEAAGVEMILSGHLHVAHASDSAGFRSDDRRIIAVTAGTCISTRRRGEPNGYNHLTIDGDSVAIVHRLWDGRRFVPGASKTYRRRNGELVKTAATVSPAGEAAVRSNSTP